MTRTDPVPPPEQPTTEAQLREWVAVLIADSTDPEQDDTLIDAALAEARAAERRAVIPSANDLTDIIEQAIFETDTGLEAALLATERILDAVATDTPEEPER
jgi:hypothetical protein